MLINLDPEVVNALKKIGSLRKQLKEEYGEDVWFSMQIKVRKDKEKIGYIKILPAPDYAKFYIDKENL